MTFSLKKPLLLWYYTHTTPNLKLALTHLVLWDILLNSDKTLAPWNDDLHFSLKHIKYLLYQCSVNIFDICQTNNVHVSSSKIFQLIVNAQSFWEVLPHIIRYQLSIYDMRYLRYLLKHFLAFPYSNQISFQMPLSTIPSANNRYRYLLLWVLLRYLSHFVWYLGLKSYPRWVIIIYLQECYQSTVKCLVASSRKQRHWWRFSVAFGTVDAFASHHRLSHWKSRLQINWRGKKNH